MKHQFKLQLSIAFHKKIYIYFSIKDAHKIQTNYVGKTKEKIQQKNKHTTQNITLQTDPKKNIKNPLFSYNTVKIIQFLAKTL